MGFISKRISLALTVLLALGLSSCGGAKASSSTESSSDSSSSASSSSTSSSTQPTSSEPLIPLEAVCFAVETPSEFIERETYQTQILTYPKDTTQKEMKYSSSASSIISIDDKGLLTAVAPGSASLTVTSVYDEEITYTSNLITVKAYVGVTGLEIDKASTSVRLGGFKSLDVAFSPSDASYQNYSCSSDNESVMKVNEKGLVTCLCPGSATITVTSKDNPEVHDSVLLTALDGYDDYEIDTHVSDKIKCKV